MQCGGGGGGGVIGVGSGGGGCGGPQKLDLFRWSVVVERVV